MDGEIEGYHSESEFIPWMGVDRKGIIPKVNYTMDGGG